MIHCTPDLRSHHSLEYLPRWEAHYLASHPFPSCMACCPGELCLSKVAAKEQPSPPGDRGRVGGREGVGI